MKTMIRGDRGLSLIELVVTMVILGILASAIVPMARMTTKRMKELELRRNLRILRTAIDDYKKANEKALQENKKVEVINQSGYPKDLKVLVEGDDFGGLSQQKKKFLRRIPEDPFNPPKPGEEPKWGLRSYNDNSTSTQWGGEDVFDVYSLSEETAINGTKYKDW